MISCQQLHGKVMYNAETSSSTPQYLCAYVSQNDLHHPEMTVRETINFASNMLGANNEFGRSVFLVFFIKITKLNSYPQAIARFINTDIAN